MAATDAAHDFAKTLEGLCRSIEQERDVALREISAEIGSLHERLTAAETELADAVRRVSDAKLAALAEQQASLSLPTAGAEGGAEAPLLMPCTSTGFTSPLDIVAAAEAIDALRAHGVEFYRLMGERQQAEAHHWLGLRYQSGDGGVSQDLGKAFEQFQTSAQAGSLDAQFSLACRYLNGEGTRKDLGEGLRLLRAAADAGHPDAMNALATRYFTGSGVAQDMAEAVRYFEQAAAAGQRVAAYNFATCYYNGDGVEADHALAARYYKQAADAGLPKAQLLLAELFEAGEGVEQNMDEAMRYYKLAASQGEAEAQNAYAETLIQQRLDEPEAWAEAQEFLEQAARQGHCTAQYNLAEVLQTSATAADAADASDASDASAAASQAQAAAAAARWFAQAAAQGHVLATYKLALCHATGKGVVPDPQEANRFLQLAAAAAHAPSQYALGWRRYKGEGCTPSLEEARQLFSLAAEQGHEQARRTLEHFGELALSFGQPQQPPPPQQSGASTPPVVRNIPEHIPEAVPPPAPTGLRLELMEQPKKPLKSALKKSSAPAPAPSEMLTADGDGYVEDWDSVASAARPSQDQSSRKLLDGTSAAADGKSGGAPSLALADRAEHEHATLSFLDEQRADTKKQEEKLRRKAAKKKQKTEDKLLSSVLGVDDDDEDEDEGAGSEPSPQPEVAVSSQTLTDDRESAAAELLAGLVISASAVDSEAESEARLAQDRAADLATWGAGGLSQMGWGKQIQTLGRAGWVEPLPEYDEIGGLVGTRLFVMEHGFGLLKKVPKKKRGWGPASIDFFVGGTKVIILRLKGKEMGTPFLIAPPPSASSAAEGDSTANPEPEPEPQEESATAADTGGRDPQVVAAEASMWATLQTQSWGQQLKALTGDGWTQPSPEFDAGQRLVGCGLYVMEHGFGVLVKISKKKRGWSPAKVLCHDGGTKTLILRLKGKEMGTPFLYKTSELGPATPVGESSEDQKAEAAAAAEQAKQGLALLKSVPACANLSAAEFDALYAGCTRQTFERGVHIIEQGTQTVDMYFLLAGQAQALIHDTASPEHTVAKDYVPGDYFGELAPLGEPGTKRAADVLVTSASATCLCLGGEQVSALLATAREALLEAAQGYTHPYGSEARVRSPVPSRDTAAGKAEQDALISSLLQADSDSSDDEEQEGGSGASQAVSTDAAVDALLGRLNASDDSTDDEDEGGGGDGAAAAGVGGAGKPVPPALSIDTSAPPSKWAAPTSPTQSGAAAAMQLAQYDKQLSEDDASSLVKRGRQQSGVFTHYNEKVQQQYTETRSTPRGAVPSSLALDDDADVATDPESTTPQRRKRAKAVVGKATKRADHTYRPTEYPKSFQEQGFLQKILKSADIFAHLTDEQQRQLLGCMQKKQVAAHEVVIQQGDHGTQCFIIASGTYECIKRQSRKELTSLSTAALKSKYLFCASRCSGAGDELDRPSLEAFLTRDLRLNMSPAETERAWQAMGGDTHVGFGAFKHWFSTDPVDMHVLTLGSGSYFGELSLLYDEPRAATVIASEAGLLWSIDIRDFQHVVVHGNEIKAAMVKDTISKVTEFSKLGPEELQQMADAMATQEFADGEAIIEQDEVVDDESKFYIIESGKVSVTLKDMGEVAVLSCPACFGERAILTSEPRNATIRAQGGPVACITLSRVDFERILGQLQDLIALASERENDLAGEGVTFSMWGDDDPLAAPASGGGAHASKPARRGSISGVAAGVGTKASDFDGVEISKDDFTHGGVLGKGSFGLVTHVRHKSNGKYYAMKAMSKHSLIEMDQVSHIMNEKRVQTMCFHPLVTNLHGCFQDDRNLYMVMEFVKGGELYSVMGKEGSLDEDGARFYTAEILEALVYLHSNNVAYRDLKPENVLLDGSGHVKITDFGFATPIPHGEKTYTVCGTPDYISPEIIQQAGHSFSADFWALGVCMYEMITGKTPFATRGGGFATYRKVMKGVFTCPDSMSASAQALLQGLLQKDVSKRFGRLAKGADDIREHAWYIDAYFNWSQCHKLEMEPPFVPEVTGDDDTSAFVLEADSDEEDPADWINASQAIQDCDQAQFEGF